jgi:hypothetical protein
MGIAINLYEASLNRRVRFYGVEPSTFFCKSSFKDQSSAVDVSRRLRRRAVSCSARRRRACVSTLLAPKRAGQLLGFRFSGS